MRVDSLGLPRQVAPIADGGAIDAAPSTPPRRARHRLALGARLCSLERDFGEAPQLAAVQLLRPLLPQQFDRAHADAQMLIHALAVELVGHAGQLDLAVQRLVAHAEQRAVGNAKAEAVGGDGRRSPCRARSPGFG